MPPEVLISLTDFIVRHIGLALQGSTLKRLDIFLKCPEYMVPIDSDESKCFQGIFQNQTWFYKDFNTQSNNAYQKYIPYMYRKYTHICTVLKYIPYMYRKYIPYMYWNISHICTEIYPIYKLKLYPIYVPKIYPIYVLKIYPIYVATCCSLFF